MRKLPESKVREAAFHNLGAVVDLWEYMLELHHNLDGRFWDIAPEGRQKFREWMASALADAQRTVFVAERSDRIIGFTHGMLKGSPPPLVPRKGGIITDFVIDEELHRTGIGRDLLRAIKTWFTERDVEELTLTVAIRNEAALAFWRAMGFECWTYTMWKPMEQ